MLHVKSVADVFRIIQEEFSGYTRDSESVSLLDAPGRVLTQEIVAEENIPSFNKSAVDGYAVIASDTFGASESIPAQLLKGPPVEMGTVPEAALTPGTACYIPTGGQLPPGSDGVVMVEYSDDYGDEYIYLNTPAAPGTHIIFAGDDIQAGDRLLQPGKRLSPADTGMLAALGVTQVQVRRRLKVGILATGDEIIPIEQTPVGSQVRDINSYVVCGALKAHHVEPTLYGIAGDQFEQIRTIALKALAENDLVLISGGSSAGTKDETAKIIESLGTPGVLVHGIAVKPGKPTIIGKCGSKAVIGLPGHPASAFMICTIFVTALLDTLTGVAHAGHPRIRARVKENYPSNSGREEFVPVALSRGSEGLLAEALLGKSGQIRLMALADGYIHINREKEGLMRGDTVEVLLAPGAAYGV